MFIVVQTDDVGVYVVLIFFSLFGCCGCCGCFGCGFCAAGLSAFSTGFGGSRSGRTFEDIPLHEELEEQRQIRSVHDGAHDQYHVLLVRRAVVAVEITEVREKERDISIVLYVL